MAASEFLVEVEAGFAAGQQAMARVTGNYKRGNWSVWHVIIREPVLTGQANRRTIIR